MTHKIENLRNIGIIAHIDAGKTTVTENMLFMSGAKHRAGRVDDGTTTTDSDKEEQERGITIYAACVKFHWGDITINLLDTPGHVDFTAEVERCLRVLDGAVVVFSAREGVEAQSETVWRQADKYHVPRIVFINKLDREGAEFERVFEEVKQRLHASPLAVQIPVGQGPPHFPSPFRGVIDLIDMRMLTFDPAAGGKSFQAGPIPPEFEADALAWREAMLEKLYNYSNEMMELALQEEPIPPELVLKVLRQATLARQIQPVLCGSALQGAGIQPLLDAVGRYLPCPLDVPPVEGVDPKKPNVALRRKPSPKEPFSGLVFKIIPAKTGDNYWVRVYSGQLKQNSRALNPRLDKRENVAQLWQIHATKKERDGQIELVDTGDIVAVIGPRDSITGDTFCDPKEPILLPGIQFAESVLSMAIEPENSTERKKLQEALEMLKRQDPTFRAKESEETGQTLISGMGELHLEIIRNRLLDEFSLNVKVHQPRVSYRETIDRAVEVVGECHRQHAGQQLFARVRARVEPLPTGEGVLVRGALPPEALPPELAQAAAAELRAQGEGGGLIGGFPLTKTRVTLLGGEFNENSNEMAFTIAAADAFRKALEEAGPVLLEPIMRVEISTPDEYFGDFVNDLQQRRGLIVRTEQRGGQTVIEAHAPLSELFGYTSRMRGLSQGRASTSMEPHEYAPAPRAVAESFAI